jgi:DnaJ-class molecular chaperone
MEFGKRRFPVDVDRTPHVIQETCERCYGTGRIRERGTRIICKACGGSGRLTVTEGREEA